MMPKRALAHLAGAAALLCSVGVLMSEPAAADAPACVRHMERVGLSNAEKKAYQGAEKACDKGEATGDPEACEEPMREAIDHHNMGDEPWINPMQGLIACDLAADL